MSSDDNNKNSRGRVPTRNLNDTIKKLKQQTELDKHQEQMRRQADANAKREREERKIKAAEETAANTAAANERLNEIIKNQNEYIKYLKKQLDASQLQLQALDKLFVSLEDGISVEKEFRGLIQSQIDETHPLWDYVKDKGGDIAVGVGTPVLYEALKMYLASKGIDLP